MRKCPEGLEIRIVSSKTDVYRNGKVLFLAEQEGVSVSNLLRRYMEEGNLKLGENKFPIGKVVRKKCFSEDHEREG